MRKGIGFMLLLLFCLSFSFSQDAKPAPTWYLVSNQELSKLETISASSEAARAKAELLLSRSQETAKRLSENSATLTRSLRQEREITQRLEKSFNQFVVDRSNSERAILARAVAAERDLVKAKAQRAIILTIAIVEALAILGTLLYKFRAALHKLIPF